MISMPGQKEDVCPPTDRLRACFAGGFSVIEYLGLDFGGDVA